MISIPITRLPHGEGLPLPDYATPGAAGMDAVAAVIETHMLAPGARFPVPLGFCMAIPDGYEVQVRPRSGLAMKHGITVPNSPGTIDSDYRGEIAVILINHGTTAFAIARGDRIAQGVIAAASQADLVEVASLDETQRGTGGFGSTGKA
jgi:dUTP pyrophosphatase